MRDIEGLLIDLLAPDGAAPDLAARLAALDRAEWMQLDERADQHRLSPYLHYSAIEQTGLAIPDFVATRWRRSAKASTVEALLHQRDLFATVELLRGRDIEPVALKGAALAFTAYPQPGLRPMRDLDLWISADRAIEAHRALLEADYHAVTPGDPESLLARHHQLPLLLAPGGDTHVEIHIRLFHEAIAEDPSLQPGFEATGMTIDIAGRPLRVPNPEHQLLHLMGHAAYDHRFDNGPLCLPDIAWLTRLHDIDWPRYHAMTGRMRRASDLLLGLVKKRFSDATIDGLGTYDDAAEALIIQLMGQDIQHRGGARLLGNASKIRSAFPSRARSGELYGATARRTWPISLLRHWWRLAVTRVPRLFKARQDDAARDLAGLDERYRDWLATSSQNTGK